jgi:outer membrane lipoprotein-sorting protein
LRFAALIISLVALRGEDLPDAAVLLERSAHALDGYKSYQFDYSLVDQSTTASGEISQRYFTSASIAGMTPGKVEVELRSPGVTQVLIYDGQTTTTYDVAQNTYLREPGRAGWTARPLQVGDARLPKNSDVTRSTIREETIDVDGEPHECWVIERSASRPWPAPGLPSRREEIQETTWIDKKLWIDWQVISISATSSGNPVQITARKTRLKLNPDLPNSMFTFTPPAGAKESFRGVH